MRWPSALSRLRGRILDVFYPRICPECGCRSDREERYLCWSCMGKVRLKDRTICMICGKTVQTAREGEFPVCSECRSELPAYDRCRSAAVFAGPVRKMIHQFKYSGGLWLAEDFGDFLHGCFRMHYSRAEIDLILPVPLHFRKYFSRGYNQAAVLAATLSSRTQIPWRHGFLRRRFGTVTQTFLSASARRKNVQNAFRIHDPKHLLAGKIVLLVDDVVTTGATLNECARLLKEAGAKAVHCLTAASGY